MIAMDVELAAKPMNPKTNWPTPLIHQLQQDHVRNEELSLINLVFCKKTCRCQIRHVGFNCSSIS